MCGTRTPPPRAPSVPGTSIGRKAEFQMKINIQTARDLYHDDL